MAIPMGGRQFVRRCWAIGVGGDHPVRTAASAVTAAAAATTERLVIKPIAAQPELVAAVCGAIADSGLTTKQLKADVARMHDFLFLREVGGSVYNPVVE